MPHTMQSDFTLERTFDAPLQKVFDAYSKEEHLCNWWGSIPFDLVVCELDFQPNGRFFYGLVSSDFKMHGVFDYLEIEAPNMITYINYFANDKGFPIRHPMSNTWPIKMINSITFKKAEGEGDELQAGEEKTYLQIVVSAYQANEIEMETFQNGLGMMKAGFKGTFDKLEGYLKTME